MDVGHDTESRAIEQKHIDFIAGLTPKTRELIVKRLAIGRGSWDALEALLPSARRAEIQELRSYEAIHTVHLGFYYRLYKQQDQKGKTA